MAEANSDRNYISTKRTATTNQQMISTEFTWIIRNFSLSPEQLGEYLTSPSFCSDQLTDVVWRLRLYPMGNETWGYVALMLQLVSCGKEEWVYASCEFAIIDTYGKKKYTHEEKQQKLIPASLIGTNKLCIKRDTFTHEEGVERRKVSSKSFGILGKNSQVLHGNDLIIRCKVHAIGRSELSINIPPCPADDEISTDLFSLLESGSLSDFMITVGAVKYPVHKAILAARSSPFLAMLEADNGEAAEIEDVAPETVYEMLRYVYTGKVKHLEEKAEDLLRLAQRYRLNGLKALCEKALFGILTLENAVHLLVFSDDHLALELKNNVIQLFRIHANEICRTEEWKSVAEKKPHLVQEVLQALIEGEFQLKCEKNLADCEKKSES